MKHMKIIVVMLTIIAIFTGCASSKPLPSITTQVAFSQTQLSDVSKTYEDSVKASNRLGYSLLLQMQEGKNTLFSPVSLSMALAMAYNAANGETANNIAETMGDSDRSLINAHYNALIGHLNRTNDEDAIKIGNSFWIRHSLNAKQDFVDALSKHFDAEIFQLDFTKADAVSIMNQWVEDKTNGLLKDTLTEIDQSTIAYLMNTVYFKGKWLHAFSEHATTAMPFSLETGGTAQVDMMSQTEAFLYYENSDVQVAALPYKDNTRMVIYLPKGDLSDFLSSYDYDQLSALNDFDMTRLMVSLPRFEYSVSNPLKEPLIALGMTLPFNDAQADFTRMIDLETENVFIGDIFQNAKIINDEAGTEAAAVTVIEFTVTSMPIVEEPLMFNCNKPFLYVIEDINTGAALFMGTYWGQE